MNNLVTKVLLILILIPLVISAQTYTRFSSSNSDLPHNQVYCIDFDNNGNIWFGGQKNPVGIANVSKLSSDLTTWTVYNQVDLALPEDRAFYMACDNSNNMWFCTHYGLSVLRSNGTAELISWTNDNYSRTIQTDSQGNIYYSERTPDERIYFSSDEGATWTAWTAADIGMSSGRPEIYDLREDSQGQLWFCTFYGVFYRDLSNVWHAIPSPVEGAYTYAMTKDLNDHMWVPDNSTQDLYEILPDETVNVYNSTNWAFLANPVNDLECDVNGTIWFATDGTGLVELFPDGTFNQYDSLTTSGQIPQNNITHLEIKDDVIWLSTADSGIVRISGMIVNSLDEETGEQTPQSFNLSQNYPNPFNPLTNIEFSLERLGHVKLDVYNMQGQLVKSLVNREYDAGDYTVTWNGTDNNNEVVSSGIYMYKLQTGDKVASKKMILMK